MNSKVSCTFEWVLSSALCNNFTIADKSVSFLLASLNWEWSNLFYIKKSLLFESFRTKQFSLKQMFDRFSKIVMLFFGFRYDVRLLLLLQISFHEFWFFFLSFLFKKFNMVVLESLGKRNQQSTKLKREHPQRQKKFESDTQTEIFSVFTFWVIKNSLTVAQAKESKNYLWTKPTQCVPLFCCKLTIKIVEFLPLLVLISLALLGCKYRVDQIYDKKVLYEQWFL